MCSSLYLEMIQSGEKRLHTKYEATLPTDADLDTRFSLLYTLYF